MRLGILTSHPIQYQAPWFRVLAKAVDLQVFFCYRQSAEEQGSGFGVSFNWDVDLLSGYCHSFLSNVARVPGVNRFGGCDTPEIRCVIRDGKFDAFIVSGWHLKSYWQAVRACRRYQIPVLVRGDSQLRTPRSPLRRTIKKLTHQVMLRQFDGFLVVGQRHREYLAHYNVPQRKMFFAPHFVDNEWFGAKAEFARNQSAEIRKRWGADEKTLVVLFVGKLQAVKRPEDILHASALLTTQHSTLDIRSVFVGAGDMEPALRNLALSLGVSARFEGFKNQSELPRYYTAADVLVLPSQSETWGLVVNEAMACGLPAIVSDAVGCAPDMVEEGLTGFTFPVGDIEVLAHRLIEIGSWRREQHDFTDALRKKTSVYSVEGALQGTLRAARQLSATRVKSVAPVVNTM
jgi:glycosyltransferase involved in cell wall biosynthesis